MRKHAQSPLGFLIILVVLLGCDAQSAPSVNEVEPITDEAYLTQALWNDGQAEVAFYQVERTRNQYGEDVPQQFLVGTYLVKHDFDQEAMSKAGTDATEAVSSFKYALFYEFESGSYQYKKNYVINAKQDDLTPLKASYTSFDWCSNVYSELAFSADGTVDVLMRSDDYGNQDDTVEYRRHAYPIHQIPLLIRGLDFSKKQEHAFLVMTARGAFIQAHAQLEGEETVALSSGTVPAERIVIRYEEPMRSVIDRETDLSETYWRGTGADRLLLKLESETGRYRMTLVEHLRSPYWQEDFWPRLKRVTQRP